MTLVSRAATSIAALSILVAGSGHARADDPLVLRPLMMEPARLAGWLRDNDPQVDAARARLEAARAARLQAGVFPNPQLNAGIGGFVLGATTPESPRLGLRQTTNITAGVSELFEIGKRGPRQQAAQRRADEAREVTLATLGARVGDAMTVLGRLAYVGSRRAAVAANLEAAKKLQALEKFRLDHQDLAGTDFSRIQLETQQLEIALGRADADVAIALSECSALLHGSCSIAGVDDPAVLDAGAPLPAQLPGIAAIEQRPAREASRLEASALAADATLAAHRAIPDPTLGVGYTYDNLTVAGNQQQTAMLTLSIPLPLFDRGDHDAAAARAAAHAVAAQDRAVVREAQGQVEALLAQRASLERTLSQLVTDAVPRSEQIVVQMRRTFDLGQAALSDLLLAERSHRELLLEVLDTRFDLFNVRVQLRQALGLDDQAARDAGRL